MRIPYLWTKSMTKHNVTEKSLKNLEKGKATRFSGEFAVEAQKKATEKKKENKIFNNTIEAICKTFSDSCSSKDIKEAFANYGFDVDTKLQNLIAQVFVQGLSKNASMRDKIALLDFISKHTGQEPAIKYAQTDSAGNDINAPIVSNADLLEIMKRRQNDRERATKSAD